MQKAFCLRQGKARVAHCPLQAHVGAGGVVGVADACSSSSGRDKVTVGAAKVSLSANASASKSVPFSIDRKRDWAGEAGDNAGLIRVPRPRRSTAAGVASGRSASLTDLTEHVAFEPDGHCVITRWGVFSENFKNIFPILSLRLVNNHSHTCADSGKRKRMFWYTGSRRYKLIYAGGISALRYL